MELRTPFLIPTTRTNAYRLINAEGDNLPGLVVDRYDDVLVMQIATLGMEKLKPQIVEMLRETPQSPRDFRKIQSCPAARRGSCRPKTGCLPGPPKPVDNRRQDPGKRPQVPGRPQRFPENRFVPGPARDARAGARACPGRKVLNCFAYTGGFTVAALAGGAIQADSVEASEKALMLARRKPGAQ